MGAIATIGDVAKRAGVSAATVSRALRGLPNVAPATRQRVLLAATELRYVADPHASRLAAGKTRSVGVVVPTLARWYFSRVVSAAERVVSASGFDVLLYALGDADGRERFLSSLPFRKRVDGLIVVGLALTREEEQALASTGTPVVMVGTASEVFPSVRIDDVAAAMTATRHLANLGHVDIGLICGALDDPLNITVPRDRRSGYRQALHQHGLVPRPELEAPAAFTLQGGAEAMAQLLAAHPAPTAVFAQSDEMAIGALRTMRNSRLRVPEDLSIVGFDDHDMAAFVGLTTVAQPVAAQGRLAAELLLRSGGEALPAAEVVLPTKLRVRTSTGPLQSSGSG